MKRGSVSCPRCAERGSGEHTAMEGQPHRTQALSQIYQRKLRLHGCGGPGFTKISLELSFLFSLPTLTLQHTCPLFPTLPTSMG